MTFAAIDGELVSRVTLHVPARGVWYAEADMVTAPELAGPVTIALGQRTFRATVDATASGAFGLQRRVRLIGGGGGWGTLLPAKAYHNDAGVRAQLVAQDAAREAGETLGDFAPAVDPIGVDYVRQSGPAARVLEDVIGGAPWWVGFDGITRVGDRDEVEADPDAFEVLEYHPREQMVTLAVDDVGAVGIGSVLEAAQLEESLTVRELRIDVGEDAIRVRAWTGGEGSPYGRLAGAVRALARRATDDRLHGVWPYRVVQMSSERVELQAVRQRAGLPDVLPVSMRPGLAGAHAELAPGTEVLVQFIEGDRAQPVVTHFAGKDGAGWTPANITLDVSTLIKLGEGASSFVALSDYVDDRLSTVQSTFDGHIHTTTATIGTGPTVGVISPPTSSIGALSSVAASKVKAE